LVNDKQGAVKVHGVLLEHGLFYSSFYDIINYKERGSDNMLDNVSIYHSSIRLNFEKTIYFDPFKIENEFHDADMIFITHEHYDHYSKEDIDKIINESTLIIAPKSMQGQVAYPNVKYVEPEKEYEENGIKFSTVRAYNVGKKFHPKENCWVGYIVELDGTKYYIAGDTDITEETETKSDKCASDSKNSRRICQKIRNQEPFQDCKSKGSSYQVQGRLQEIKRNVSCGFEQQVHIHQFNS
jgi:hypothetical protein